MMFSRVIHVGTCVSTSCFVWLNNILLCGYRLHLVYSFVILSVVRHLGCYNFGAVMSNTAVVICIQVLVWALCFHFSGHIPRSGIAGLGREMGDLLHTVVTKSL